MDLLVEFFVELDHFFIEVEAFEVLAVLDLCFLDELVDKGMAGELRLLTHSLFLFLLFPVPDPVLLVRLLLPDLKKRLKTANLT